MQRHINVGGAQVVGEFDNEGRSSRTYATPRLIAALLPAFELALA
jgi:hypothetical protein